MRSQPGSKSAESDNKHACHSCHLACAVGQMMVSVTIDEEVTTSKLIHTGS